MELQNTSKNVLHAYGNLEKFLKSFENIVEGVCASPVCCVPNIVICFMIGSNRFLEL